ncbi:MAG: ABC transporter substrate-binding protein [Chitinophagales bacterium]
MFRIKISHINVCLIVCFLFFSACGSGKKAQKTPSPPVKKEGKVKSINDNTMQEKVEDLTENKPTPTIFTPDVNDLKEVKNLPDTHSLSDAQIASSFNIAIMLPFNVSNYYPNEAYDSIPKKSRMALEYYEGILVALDNLRGKGFDYNVQVYDTENNTAKVSQILSEPEMKNMNLIIGPIYNRPLKTVADFARQHQIYHVSPLSPSKKVTYNNPYYLVANPSVETHCAAMYEYMNQNFSNKKIIVIGGNDSQEQNLSSLFYQFANNNNSSESYPSVDITQVVYTDQSEEDLETYFSPNQQNIVVITSFKELQVANILRKIHFFHDRYQIALFGMPNWRNLEALDLDYLVNLNFHISSSVWVNEFSAEHQQFKHAYQAKFNTFPSKNAIKGYDLMGSFAQIMQTYGTNFGLYLNEINQKGVYVNYSFEPSSLNKYKNSSIITTDFMENMELHILKYRSDYRFEKAN